MRREWWRETRVLNAGTVEQSAILCALKFCRFLLQRRLTCHVVSADEDARRQTKANSTFSLNKVEIELVTYVSR